MNFHGCKVVIIEAGPLQALVIQAKSQRLDQMQSGAGVRAQANDVAGITRNLRLEQHDMKHEFRLWVWSWRRRWLRRRGYLPRYLSATIRGCSRITRCVG